MDSFLQAHIGYTDNVFNLGGRTPLSIRDQIVRAHYLVERLFSSAYRDWNPTLLVVGGGVAGVTVATLAARRQANVLLVDASESPFRLQQQCARWIDPVQHDWPAPHSDKEQWPISGLTSAVPFGFAAGTASSIARKWVTALSKERLRSKSNLKVCYNAELAGLPKGVKSGQVSATIYLKDKKQFVIGEYDIVILARGVFDEKTEVPFYTHAASPSHMFVGRKFWEDDTYQTAASGFPLP